MLTTLNFPPELQLGSAQAGALLGEEYSSEVYVWSHAGGHLRSKTRSEGRITAIEQERADNTDPATPPGVPVALERSVTVTAEMWTPIEGGLWRHGTTRSAAAKLPVRDKTTGEWVKQISAPIVSRSGEITDNAPPSVSDPNIPSPEEQSGQSVGSAPMFPVPPPFQYLRDPQIQTVALTGSAPGVSVSLPMVEDYTGEFTRSLGRIATAELAPRTERTFRSTSLEPLQLRHVIDGFGLIRSFKIGGRAGSLSLEAACDDPDLI